MPPKPKGLWKAPQIWPGGTCYILGGGPSLAKVDLSRLKQKGVRVIAVNNAYQLGQWDCMFFGDCRWYNLPDDVTTRKTTHGQALLNFAGLKVTTCYQWIKQPGIRVMERCHTPKGLYKDSGKLGWNDSSGACAINLAVHFGVKRIILLGFDMRRVDLDSIQEEQAISKGLGIMQHHGRDPANWHKNHPTAGKKSHNPYREKFLPPFEVIARDLKRFGVECLNATPGSALSQFPIVDPDDVLPTRNSQEEGHHENQSGAKPAPGLPGLQRARPGCDGNLQVDPLDGADCPGGSLESGNLHIPGERGDRGGSDQGGGQGDRLQAGGRDPLAEDRETEGDEPGAGGQADRVGSPADRGESPADRIVRVLGDGIGTGHGLPCLTVATTYTPGGGFSEEYVRRLAAGCFRNLKIDHRFIALTKLHESRFLGPYINVKPLTSQWPGWWAKMELFKIPGPVLTIDLDTVLVSSIQPIAEAIIAQPADRLMMLKGFYRADQCSGVMGWNGDWSWLHDDFEHWSRGATFRPAGHGVYMQKGRHRHRGDQEWIRDHLKAKNVGVDLIQDHAPGIYSFKVNCQQTGRVPADASMIVFHGKPRPNDLAPWPRWMRESWGLPLGHVPNAKPRYHYTTKHQGTLIILGSAEGGLDELARVRRHRPKAKVMAIGFAAASTKVSFIVSDHYETHTVLRQLQEKFGTGHFTTHCAMTTRWIHFQDVDHWWNIRRPDGSSVETGIRIGFEMGFTEVILCGSPLEAGPMQHREQREKDGPTWPPPRIGARGELTATPDEHLKIMRDSFTRSAEEWIGNAFSMSGHTREILGAPRGIV